jgi:hypothetical protein
MWDIVEDALAALVIALCLATMLAGCFVTSLAFGG